MARGRAETRRWEKLCKNILVMKTLNKLYLTIFYLYILRFLLICGLDTLQHSNNTRTKGFNIK